VIFLGVGPCHYVLLVGAAALARTGMRGMATACRQQGRGLALTFSKSGKQQFVFGSGALITLALFQDSRKSINPMTMTYG